MSDSNQNQSKGKQDYLVLARKYRPLKFDDVVGQDALVRTLKNAIESGRLHHAYILQGIRGIGKTTTARLLAKVLNCTGGPSISWSDDDANCKAIEVGNHVDVLEFDAASHTGVDDIRELFDGVNYAPIQGKYKVYIIDEVHMLSKQAFNALLKTLEEPPEHVKFIFATTEANKIPLTVLSRCQRFDLKRISADDLFGHFKNILIKENVEAEDSAIMQIARAADGSARDGLSLLDQAIALSVGSSISDETVSEMLGAADRTRMYDLFEEMTAGNTTESLDKLSALYENGFDPMLIVADLMQIAHLITRLKVVPHLAESSELSEIERTRGSALADTLGLENLSRAYQMLLTVLEEAKRAPRPFEVVEMGVIRVTHLAPLPAIAQLVEAAKAISGGTPVKKLNAQSVIEHQPAGTPLTVMPMMTDSMPTAQSGFNIAKREVSANPTSETATHNAIRTDLQQASPHWLRLVKMIEAADQGVGGAIESQVRALKIDPTEAKIAASVSHGLFSPKDMEKKLASTLFKVTGKSWTIKLLSDANIETASEARIREADERRAKARRNADIIRILHAFEGAQVTKVTPL